MVDGGGGVRIEEEIRGWWWVGGRESKGGVEGEREKEAKSIRVVEDELMKADLEGRFDEMIPLFESSNRER